MKPIKLQNGLWAVSVPMNVENVKISQFHTRNLFFEEKGFLGINSVELYCAKWKILGTVDKNTISFDVDELIHVAKSGLCKDYTCNYIVSGQEFKLTSAEESFRSLLSSKGLTDYEKIIILKEI